MEEGLDEEFAEIRADLEPAVEETIDAIESADADARPVLIERLHGIARQLHELDRLEARFEASLVENELLREQLRETGAFDG